ncbi:MAG TPA: hypothetical protein VK675_03470 [Candidatus Paceibacterota bacterium]|nr:hypothetical protein [Candidatus Paceibacterota bacterium]
MNNDFKNRILEKVHKKEILMYPKIYFIVRLILAGLISIAAFFLLIFSLSFVFFSIQESGRQFLLGFGIQGIITFMILFPWVMIIFTAILFFLLEWILRHFKFAYQLPVVRIFIYSLFVTIFASILFTLTPIHLTFLKKADVDELPIIGGIYESIHDSAKDKGVIRGNVYSIQNNSLILSHNDNDKDADDGTWNVIFPAGFDLAKFRVGEKVYVAGKIDGNNIYAYGIHAFPRDR